MKKNDTRNLRLPSGKEPPLNGWTLAWVLIALLVLWGWQEAFERMAIRTIPYSEFRELVAEQSVEAVTIKTDEIVGRARRPAELTDATAATEDSVGDQPVGENTPALESAPVAGEGTFIFRTIRMEDPKLVDELVAAGVEFTAVRPNPLTEILIGWLLPLALVLGFWIMISRRAAGMAEGMLGQGRSRAKLIVDRNTGVTFNDVAGCDEAKQDLREVVEFLRNPARYESLGARIPKGALLVGPPGTGKTLLAKAVAGEAGVPFFSMSGSDFVEMFVGVGAARVRDLFKQAKQHAPCIIFIDEIDAIGRQRGVHVGAVNDEREQTLNALLVEMDGFEANTGVVILAATNRPEVLDRALLRPGRFDRQIVVDSPDLDGREAILRVHARNKKLADDVDLRRLAAATAGFSGADLANVLNEAALLAARREATAITQEDLEQAIEKVVAGPERRSRRLNPDDKRRVAYHEVGHAMVAAFSEHADPVHKISIVPRGRAALGYTMQLPNEDQFLLTRSELFDRICGLLGGRAAEEIVFGEVTTGAQNDLERATALARQMVAIYGMSERIGLTHCGVRQSQFLAGPEGGFHRDCSEQTAREIDEEVRRILDEAYQRAKEILSARRETLEQVTATLLECETLDGAEFYRLVGREMPHVKEPVPPMPSAAGVSEALGQSRGSGGKGDDAAAS